jgi:chemotaxis methyl-accepting protein methylase
MVRDGFQTVLASAISRARHRCLGAYLFQVRRIWNKLPPSVRVLSPGRAYGRHLHALVRRHAERKQYFATFFLRNRAELELICRLLDQKPRGASLDISVLACSKGAEVYSVLWAIRSARPDLKLRLNAVDVSQQILTFAENGVYSLSSSFDAPSAANHNGITEEGDVARNTTKDQDRPIFERVTSEELEAMFEIEGDQARVRSWLKEGVNWMRGDACDPNLIDVLGPQDIVLANRFLCHMEVAAADRCLRNIANLVKPGGHLFVSGIDLDIRTRVARDLGWKPVTDLVRAVHEGDPSLRRGWPLEYWGLEPFCDDRSDWRIRYASVFQVGEAPSANTRKTSCAEVKIIERLHQS